MISKRLFSVLTSRALTSCSLTSRALTSCSLTSRALTSRSLTSRSLIHNTFANNYVSLPIIITKGKDIFLWDTHGKKYIDLLAGYSAVNQGHCHPRIVSRFIEQASQLTLASRVVHTAKLYEWSNYITNLFQYEKVLAMNSGAEAVETALKLARKYGRIVSCIQRPYIVCLSGNFHGRTIGTISLSDYPSYKNGFGPFVDDIITVRTNDIEDLYRVFHQHGTSISAILYEPIQGEGGIMPMSASFIHAVKTMKKEYPHVLLMADEIQCGLGRTGYLTTSERIDMKPDVLILGKALSGGMMPMSCILANQPIMDIFTPGTHGSTFGGNPLACAVSIEALQVIQEECIPHVKNISHDFEKTLSVIKQATHVKDIRGTGLFWGIQFREYYSLESLRLKMLENGYITCTSRNNTLRITPPLTISSNELTKAIHTLSQCI
jgi:ornithine--oxo-acid transaminase